MESRYWLVINNENDKIVIGKYKDKKVLNLTIEDIELCKENNLEYKIEEENSKCDDKQENCTQLFSEISNCLLGERKNNNTDDINDILNDLQENSSEELLEEEYLSEED